MILVNWLSSVTIRLSMIFVDQDVCMYGIGLTRSTAEVGPMVLLVPPWLCYRH